MSKVLVGFGAAVLLGGGGAAGLNILAADLAPAAVMLPTSGMADTAAVQLLDVKGEVKALMPDGEWRYVRPGFSLVRPTGFEVMEPNASVTVRFRGVTVEASLGAKVLIGAPGAAFGLQLERGRIVVARAQRDVLTHIPRLDAVVSGPAYGVWAHDDEVSISVLGERAEVEHTDAPPVRYGRSREVLLTRKRATPSVLSDTLQIDLQRVTKRGRKYRYSARTARGAVVMVRQADGSYEKARVSISGSFTADLEGEKPAAGELIAFDSAGRSAEVGRPSPTLAGVVSALTGVAANVKAPVTNEEAAAIRVLGGGKGREATKASPPAAKKRPPPPPPKAVRVRPPPKAASKSDGTRGARTPDPVKVDTPIRPSAPPAAKKPEAPPPAKKAPAKVTPKVAAPKAPPVAPKPKEDPKTKPKPKPDLADDLLIDDEDTAIDEDRL